MNRVLLQAYINEYEKRFAQIHPQEIYKWRAVKQFQDSWDPDADDFAKMLSIALSKTSNLMDSGNYFPRAVIIELAEKKPYAVKRAFLDLYDEEIDVIERITGFREKIREIHARESSGIKDFQDHRATLVYLTLRYPDIYFFYKYEMFKDFSAKTQCEYKPTPGKHSNIVQFLHLCTTVKEELIKNNDLIKLHKNRLGEEEYFDVSFNILTQDFIYAVTNYLSPETVPEQTTQPGLTLRSVQLEPVRKKYIFKGRYVDYVSRHKRNKRIGDLGEQLVLQYEKSHNPKYVEKIIHSSKIDGDGLGFDILSRDNKGNSKYIEVKTTKGRADNPFYISGAELERSKKEGDNYYLYRLFNFDEKNMKADLIVLQGDLSKFCVNATEYEVVVKSSEAEGL